MNETVEYLMETKGRNGLKERIILAARSRFLQNGVAGTSFRQLARDVNASVSSVCYHFQGKDELLLAVLDPILDQLLTSIEEAYRACTTLEERMLCLCHRFEQATPTEQSVLKLVLRLLVDDPRHALTLLYPKSQRGIALLRDLVTQGYTEGKIAEDVHPLVAITCLLSIMGTQRWVMKTAPILGLLNTNDKELSRQSWETFPDYLLLRILDGLSRKDLRARLHQAP